MSEISRDEFNRLYQLVETGFQGVHSRLDHLNGRTRTTEQKIAVLEDRSDGRWWGGALGGVVVTVIEAAKWAVQR